MKVIVESTDLKPLVSVQHRDAQKLAYLLIDFFSEFLEIPLEEKSRDGDTIYLLAEVDYYNMPVWKIRFIRAFIYLE